MIVYDNSADKRESLAHNITSMINFNITAVIICGCGSLN